MRKSIVAVVAVAASAFLLGACEKVKMADEAASGTEPAVQDESPAEVISATTGTAATVAIVTANGPVNFTVQVARTDEQKAAGLMNHESLGEDAGMWFDFSSTGMGVYPFWMKDTLIPLDWIFVDDAMKIVEVKAGVAAKHGIKAGDAVQLRVGPAK